MGYPAPRPKHLAAKLLAIRRSFGIGQVKMCKRLNFYGGPQRLSEFESGRRVPSLMVLLAYARVAKIPLENIVDDSIDLASFI